MVGKPAEPAQPGRPETARHAERDEALKPVETVGPLTLLRTRKDDGRALLLYTRRDAVDAVDAVDAGDAETGAS